MSTSPGIMVELYSVARSMSSCAEKICRPRLFHDIQFLRTGSATSMACHYDEGSNHQKAAQLSPADDDLVSQSREVCTCSGPNNSSQLMMSI